MNLIMSAARAKTLPRYGTWETEMKGRIKATYIDTKLQSICGRNSTEFPTKQFTFNVPSILFIQEKLWLMLKITLIIAADIQFTLIILIFAN